MHISIYTQYIIHYIDYSTYTSSTIVTQKAHLGDIIGVSPWIMRPVTCISPWRPSEGVRVHRPTADFGDATELRRLQAVFQLAGGRGHMGCGL